MKILKLLMKLFQRLRRLHTKFVALNLSHEQNLKTIELVFYNRFKFMKKGRLLILFTILSWQIFAQEAGEIQIYSSPTTGVKSSMFELHSNISPVGPKSNKAFNPLHETIEITTGIFSNFEIGLYQFMRFYNDKYQLTGNHIRPRITAPIGWKLPVGLSLSSELGYDMDPATEKFNKTIEVRSIIDKKADLYYLALNMVFAKIYISGNTFNFMPNAKTSFNVHKKIALGLEYYGNLGNIKDILPQAMQYHQLYFVTDLNFNPDIEFNFGIGRGLTSISDGWNIKLLLGRRIHWNSAFTKPT